jgi:hypothetical protein
MYLLVYFYIISLIVSVIFALTLYGISYLYLYAHLLRYGIYVRCAGSNRQTFSRSVVVRFGAISLICFSSSEIEANSIRGCMHKHTQRGQE